MNHSAFGGQLLMGPGAQQPKPDPFMGSIAMLNKLLEQGNLELEMPSPTGPVAIHAFKYDGYSETEMYAALMAVHQFKEGGTCSHLVVFPKRDTCDLSDFRITEQYPIMPLSLEHGWKLADLMHSQMSEESVVKMIHHLGVLPKAKVGDTLVLKKGEEADDAMRMGSMNVVTNLKIVPGQRVLYAGNANAYQRHMTSRTAVVYLASTDGKHPEVREVDLTRYEISSKQLLDKKGRLAFKQQILSDGGVHHFEPGLWRSIRGHIAHVLGLATAITLAGLVLAAIFGIQTAHASAEKPPLVLKQVLLPENKPDGYSYVYCVAKVCHDIYTDEEVSIDNVDKDGYYSYVSN